MNMQGLKRSDWELEHCGYQRVAVGATFSWLNSLMNNNRSCPSFRGSECSVEEEKGTATAPIEVYACDWPHVASRLISRKRGQHKSSPAPAPVSTESIAARTPCPSAVTTAWNLWLGHWNKSPWLMIGISLPSEFVPEYELRFTPLPMRCQPVRLSLSLFYCLSARPHVQQSVYQSPKSQPQLNEKQRLQKALNCADCFGVVLLLLGNLSCVLLYCCNTWISSRDQIGGEPLAALVNADDRLQIGGREAILATKSGVNGINIASWQRTQLIKPAQPILIVIADETRRKLTNGCEINTQMEWIITCEVRERQN